MKKALFLVPFLIVLVPAFTQAQSALVLVSQGSIASTTQVTSGSNSPIYNINIGSGYAGIVTGALVTADFFDGVSPRKGEATVDIQDTTLGGADCLFRSVNSQDSNTGPWNIPFVACSGSATTTLDSTHTYNIQIQFGFDSSLGVPMTVYGTDSSLINPRFTANTAFVPQFALVSNGFIIPTPDYNALATSTCEVTNFTGCIQNALVWGFIPPPGSLDVITGLWSVLSLKPPFGYFTTTQNQLMQVGASSTPAFVLEQAEGITEGIFDPIDVGLTAIWWFIFAFWFFFNRLRHIEL